VASWLRDPDFDPLPSEPHIPGLLRPVGAEAVGSAMSLASSPAWVQASDLVAIVSPTTIRQNYGDGLACLAPFDWGPVDSNLNNVSAANGTTRPMDPSWL